MLGFAQPSSTLVMGFLDKLRLLNFKHLWFLTHLEVSFLSKFLLDPSWWHHRLNEPKPHRRHERQPCQNSEAGRGVDQKKSIPAIWVKPGKRPGDLDFWGGFEQRSFHPSSWKFPSFKLSLQGGPQKSRKDMEWHGGPATKWPYKLVAGVISYNPYLNGVIAPFITGRGWPCSIPIWINWIALVTKMPCEFQLRCLLGKHC